ncbi:hypothetical protein Taro_028054 [Colocasia esculenta]|uniref:E3 ubiquitin protein ligase n=1 Tax=Colocasia esculenta TaxID=4460 RepID=A0A843VQM5_COLES|nr:hypothetical protein [Colocasia esculenta]
MKRRHFSPVSPTVAAAAAAKKGTLFTCSEERKLDTTVLLYQNQKLGQQLEVQKFEYSVIENKFKQLKDEQVAYDDTLTEVNKSWNGLVDDLGSLLNRRNSIKGHDDKHCESLDEVIEQLCKTVNESHMEVKDLRLTVGDFHVKHKSLAKEVQAHRDTSAKYKAQTRRLAEELESATTELKESNCELSLLKSQKDTGHGTPFLLPALGSSCASDDGSRDRQKEVQELESAHKEMLIERDSIIWREKEVTLKMDIADVSRRASMVAESRSAELEKLILKLMDERAQLGTKLEEACREPGRKEIISEFKDMISSLPKDMETMQNQLAKHKGDASEIHSLRAEVRSVASILDRKENERNTLSRKSADQISEIQRLQATVQDLKQSCQELKVFLDMCKRESSDSRDVLESRDLEFKAWAHVQRLKSSLDEHCLELRVKAANEAEAIAQQRLATAEAEIAELRQKIESSGREIVELSEVLKSKCEEGEAYLSEIESIGQAYEDLQTQNQNLLQQITERDDYNIKVVL